MNLPDNFVYVYSICPNIIAHLRYLSNENFTGHVVRGYEENKVILTQPTADALVNVQREVEQNNYTLVIYDAYRPQKSVSYFIEWSQDVEDQAKKKEYYPFIEKDQIFDLGYVSRKSGHSRGSTVDLSIANIGSKIENTNWISRKQADGKEILFLDDGTLDMGSSFDFFGEASHHDTPVIAPEFIERRNFLKNVMLKHGFRAHPKEWWHYMLVKEPFPDTYFDFNVK